MKVYRMHDPEGVAPTYAYYGGLSDVKGDAKKLPVTLRKTHIVEELEVSIAKSGVVAMLNGEPEFEVKRTWGITPRGALKEEDA